MVSTNRLKERRSQFAASEWIMDSGAFTAITTLGCLPEPPEEYAEESDTILHDLAQRVVGRLVATGVQAFLTTPRWAAPGEEAERVLRARILRIGLNELE